ncbi:hypothetical protein [Staphylococcus saprophyticus]|uniref:hypothetical protein n=1 Tax=Staphylococcus saprophyticus TaxID=29385 RepID=UPI001012CB0C|nr:hypothetical protein [Staphylococcus saprophyticus]RXS21393.1 hypothetical protein EUA51_06510 [Staphylococcus saprophyticus]
MVKIKQKKQLNLPQLIEWAWDNDIRDTMIKLKSEYPAKQGIVIDNGGRLHLVGMDYLSKSNTFTVEVEEEITLDTVFEEILLIVNNGLGIEVYSNYSINDVLSNNEGYYEETVMLILKPDPEVIWTREKGLVE